MIRVYRDNTVESLIESAKLIGQQMGDMSPLMRSQYDALMAALKASKLREAAKQAKLLGMAGKSGNNTKIAKARTLARGLAERLKKSESQTKDIFKLTLSRLKAANTKEEIENIIDPLSIDLGYPGGGKYNLTEQQIDEIYSLRRNRLNEFMKEKEKKNKEMASSYDKEIQGLKNDFVNEIKSINVSFVLNDADRTKLKSVFEKYRDLVNYEFDNLKRIQKKLGTHGIITNVSAESEWFRNELNVRLPIDFKFRSSLYEHFNIPNANAKEMAADVESKALDIWNKFKNDWKIYIYKDGSEKIFIPAYEALTEEKLRRLSKRDQRDTIVLTHSPDGTYTCAWKSSPKSDASSWIDV